MKYVKLFENFKKKDIHAICKKHGIKKYTINPDGSIDVDDVVELLHINMEELPIKFGRVSEYFNCRFIGLETLKSFKCSKVNNNKQVLTRVTYI